MIDCVTIHVGPRILHVHVGLYPALHRITTGIISHLSTSMHWRTRGAMPTSARACDGILCVAADMACNSISAASRDAVGVQKPDRAARGPFFAQFHDQAVVPAGPWGLVSVTAAESCRARDSLLVRTATAELCAGARHPQLLEILRLDARLHGFRRPHTAPGTGRHGRAGFAEADNAGCAGAQRQSSWAGCRRGAGGSEGSSSWVDSADRSWRGDSHGPTQNWTCCSTQELIMTNKARLLLELQEIYG
eukprot:SAG22_NODE_497_length_9790_cov_3.684178_8_plen_248_part_00